ncbi:MAG: hypothetical protein ACFFDP_05875 [Promethearchaeota archaeon]
MSVQATQMTCAICDSQVALRIARREWWLCTTCGSFVCPRCYIIFQESGQEFCPGTIVRGVEPHPPHFTRFLARRTAATHPVEERSTVVILEDVRRRTPPPLGGRVIILDDSESEINNNDNPTGDNDDS